MAKWKLKSEFLEVGAGLVQTIAPGVSGTLDAIKDVDLTQALKDAKLDGLPSGSSRFSTQLLSGMGSIIGSPLGFLPLMQTFAAEGFGQVFARQAAEAFRPFMLDANAVTQLWLRNYPSLETRDKWWNDLRYQGWSEERIAAAQELANYLPSPQEVMTWAAREVFEPKLRTKYQLDLHLPPKFLEWAAKVGITGEVAENFWAGHWELPSLSNMVELWRRGIVDDETVKDFWTEMDMVPWIREDLFKLFKAMPTRVDLRRWWDMASITEEELRYYYKALGYWDDELERYVQWTKVYVDFPDLVARYRKGWISLATVKEALIEHGMPEARADVLLETKFKRVYSEERVAETTALTRALIIKGAKKGELDRDQTIALLMRKNYDLWEAEYIYDIEVGAAESPETPGEYARLVEAYRRSQGMDAREIPQEVIDAERELARIDKELNAAMEVGAELDVVDNLQVARVEAQTRLRELYILHEPKPPE